MANRHVCQRRPEAPSRVVSNVTRSTGRERILLAPVTVSPTKPLTPTHLKYLLSLDMIYRATSTFADVDCAYHHAVYAGSHQVAGFWEFLDRYHTDVAAADLSEEAIGRLYVAYHRRGPASSVAIWPLAQRAERGWMHPVSARLLDLWEGHYRRLGLFDPALGRGRPELAPVDELIGLLERHHLCIDGRPLRAPVYLDATKEGLPLRLVMNADEQPNYLLCLLRELIPVLSKYDLVLLAHDTDLRSDYRTIAYVLGVLGARVARFEVPRVPLDGVTRSARYGDWEGYTLDELQRPEIMEHGSAAFRLGLRLYLVAGLGRTARQSFSIRQLQRWVRRAEALLAERNGAQQEMGPYLSRLSGHRGYADPYRVATALLGHDQELPLAGLLRVVMGEEA